MGIGSRSSLLVGLSILLLSGLPSAAFAATGIESLSVTYSGPDGASIEVTNIRGDLHGNFNVNDLSAITVLPAGTDSDFNGPRTVFTIFDQQNLGGNVIDILEINSACNNTPIIGGTILGDSTSLQVDGFTGCEAPEPPNAPGGGSGGGPGSGATADGEHLFGSGVPDDRLPTLYG